MGADGLRWSTRSRRVAVLVVVAALVGLSPVPAGAVTAEGFWPHGLHYVRGGEVTQPMPAALTWTDGRTVHDTAFLPYAWVDEVVLAHPARFVERIGLHQSNHEGARDQSFEETAAGGQILESRGRLSGLQSAADVVVVPDTEIRSPVSGTVVRSGTYVLYCDYSDDYVVIAPDVRPDLEVKVLHIDGVTVQAGDEVTAGATMIAPRATVLPFGSQVDATTATPAWPHVHIEVIDPSIPNVPNGGSGGC